MPAIVLQRDESHIGFIDLNKNELRNVRLQNLGSDISSPVDGLIYYSTSGGHRVRAYINGSWEDLATMDDVTAGGISSTLIDAKGDLIVGTAADTVARKAVGADGTILVAASGQADGLEWRTLTEADINLGATDRLVGRDTAAAGAAEEITVGGGIEFTGSGGIQRSAITGDIEISAGSGTSAIGAGVIVNADVNASAGIVVSKLASSATDRLFGRDTASAGAGEEITVGGGVEFTGSGGIQRSALTGDITASAGSGTTAIAAGVIVDADVNASAAIAATKLAFTPAQNIAATNVQAAIEEVVTDLTASITAATEAKSWKDPVRAASTTNLTLSGTQTIDGIAVVAGERVLAKDQTTAADRGIYVVAAGAWSRAADMSTADEADNATVLVEAGTVNGGDVYTQTADIVTIGTTAMTWVKVSEGNTVYTASGGVTLTGSNFDTTVSGLSGGMTVGDILYASGAAALAKLAGVATGNALISGGTSTAPSWGKIGLTTHISGTLPIGNGGTNATDAATARSNLSAAGKATGALTGGSNSEVITHNLNSRDVTLTIRNNASPWDEIEVYNEATTVNTITVYAGAGNNLPASYRWTVTG